MGGDERRTNNWVKMPPKNLTRKSTVMMVSRAAMPRTSTRLRRPAKNRRSYRTQQQSLTLRDENISRDMKKGTDSRIDGQR